MAYLPNSDAERREMLDAVGAASEADLFTTIPAALRNPVIDLPPPLSE
jgi:glycine cleavage system pyridoxal-binding protein P